MFCTLLGTGWLNRADAQPTDYEYVCGTSGSSSSSSGGPENPICTDPSSVRYVRVVIHFLLREDTWVETITDNCGGSSVPPYSFTYVGPGNFTETNDGVGNPAYNGFHHAENVIGLATGMLASNEDHWRKESGINYPTPPPDINIQYLLVGVYFHRDDDAFDTAIPPTSIHAKYDVETNHVLDIYCIHRPNLGYDGNAFAFGGLNKFVYLNDYKHYLKPYCRTWSKTNTAHSLNHEIGHTLNLYHTWDGGDLCEDTPEGYIYDKVLPNGGCLPNQKANCWEYNPSIPGCPKKPCDEWSKISNNIMDYNSHDPAWTACQIGRMNQNLLDNGNPYIHSCNGCAPSQAFFYVRSPQAICPEQAGSTVFLNGHPSVNENRYLIEICRVLASLPNDCNGQYFNSGWQTGQPGNVNLSSLHAFQPNNIYKIKLTVDNTECPGSDVYEQLLYTNDDCTYPPPPCCYEMAATNPFGSHLTVYYNIPENGELSLSLINLLTSSTTTLFSSTEVDAGFYEQDFQTSSLSNGNYTLRAIFNGGVYTKNLLKF